MLQKYMDDERLSGKCPLPRSVQSLSKSQEFTTHWQNHDSLDGGTNPRGWALTYYLANFSQKLHENERNWTEGKEARVPCNTLLSTNAIDGFKWFMPHRSLELVLHY